MGLPEIQTYLPVLMAFQETQMVALDGMGLDSQMEGHLLALVSLGEALLQDNLDLAILRVWGQMGSLVEGTLAILDFHSQEAQAR